MTFLSGTRACEPRPESALSTSIRSGSSAGVSCSWSVPSARGWSRWPGGLRTRTRSPWPAANSKIDDTVESRPWPLRSDNGRAPAFALTTLDCDRGHAIAFGKCLHGASGSVGRGRRMLRSTSRQDKHGYKSGRVRITPISHRRRVDLRVDARTRLESTVRQRLSNSVASRRSLETNWRLTCGIKSGMRARGRRIGRPRRRACRKSSRKSGRYSKVNNRRIVHAISDRSPSHACSARPNSGNRLDAIFI